MDKTDKKIKDQIHRYVAGELEADEVDQLWVELLKNPYYYEYLVSCANLKAVVEKKSGKTHAHEKAQKIPFIGLRVAVAASIIFLLSITTVLMLFQEDSSDYEPLSSIELHNIRSGEAAEDVLSAQMQEGINYAVEGQSERAVNLFETLESTAEDEAFKNEARLNIGIVQYNGGDFTSAASDFNVIIQREGVLPLVEEKAWWYLTQTYLQLNEKDNAIHAAQQTYELNGAYRRMARQFLVEMDQMFE